jgi:hypothetical protein
MQAAGVSKCSPSLTGPIQKRRTSRSIARGVRLVLDAYHCITHALDFTVTDIGWIGDGTIFEGEGEWSIKAVAGETRV